MSLMLSHTACLIFKQKQSDYETKIHNSYIATLRNLSLLKMSNLLFKEHHLGKKQKSHREKVVLKALNN